MRPPGMPVQTGAPLQPPPMSQYLAQGLSQPGSPASAGAAGSSRIDPTQIPRPQLSSTLTTFETRMNNQAALPPVCFHLSLSKSNRYLKAKSGFTLLCNFTLLQSLLQVTSSWGIWETAVLDIWDVRLIRYVFPNKTTLRCYKSEQDRIHSNYHVFRFPVQEICWQTPVCHWHLWCSL